MKTKDSKREYKNRNFPWKKKRIYQGSGKESTLGNCPFFQSIWEIIFIHSHQESEIPNKKKKRKEKGHQSKQQKKKDFEIIFHNPYACRSQKSKNKGEKEKRDF